MGEDWAHDLQMCALPQDVGLLPDERAWVDAIRSDSWCALAPGRPGVKVKPKPDDPTVYICGQLSLFELLTAGRGGGGSEWGGDAGGYGGSGSSDSVKDELTLINGPRDKPAKPSGATFVKQPLVAQPNVSMECFSRESWSAAKIARCAELARVNPMKGPGLTPSAPTLGAR